MRLPLVVCHVRGDDVLGEKCYSILLTCRLTSPLIRKASPPTETLVLDKLSQLDTLYDVSRWSKDYSHFRVIVLRL